MAKYSGLAKHLATLLGPEARLTFDEIHDLIIGELPESAYNALHKYWKSEFVNAELGKEGWETYLVDHAETMVIFRRTDAEHNWMESQNEDGSSSWLKELRVLLDELDAIGEVKEIVASRQLSNGDKVHFTIAPRFRKVRSAVTLKRGQRISDIRSNSFDDSIRPDCVDSVHRAEPDDWINLEDIVETHNRFAEAVRDFIPGINELDRLGGYGCLATMSRQKSQQTGRVAVYSPAALGLNHVDHIDDRGKHCSLYGLVSRGELELQVIQGQQFDHAESIRIRINNPGRSARFVRIHVGTVFEQVNAPDVQNLAVRDLIEIEVETGCHDVYAHGMCMDESSKPPAGEPMRLSPWILALNTKELADQDSLWSATGGEN